MNPNETRMKHALHFAVAALSLAPVLSLTKAEAQPLVRAPMFGNNGGKSVEIQAGTDIGIRHALLPDGKLLLGGGGYDINCNCFHIALVKMDTLCGKLDASFGNGGTIGHVFDQRSTLRDMVVLPNGKILACGQNAPDNSLSEQVAAVYRFNADGSPDLTMNGTAWRTDRFNTANTCINNAILPLNNGRFYTTGSFSGSSFGFGVMRYLEDGSLDLSYSDDGKAWTNFGGALDTPISHDALLLPDSSVLVIGSASSSFGQPRQLIMVHFNADGTIDNGFGTNGLILTGISILEEPRAHAELLPDGNLLIGATPPQSAYGLLVARFTSNGQIDPSFGVDGISLVDISANSDYAYSMQVMPDGSIFQFGSIGALSSYIVKRTVNGQLDASFGTNGVYTIPPVTVDMSIRGGLMLGAGRMLAYGSNANEMIAVKLTNDPADGLFADLGPDTAVCAGTPFALDAGFPGSTYAWSIQSNGTTGTQQTFNTLSISATYRVTITNTLGCTDRDTIQMQVVQPPSIPLIVPENDYLYAQGFGDFQWYLNGEPILGADIEIWTPQENGTYTVSTTVGACSSFSPPYEVLTVGMTERDNNGELSAFPNPSEGIFTVHLPPGSGSSTIELIDPLGRKIGLGAKYPAAQGSLLRQIDLSGHATGVYTIRVVSEGGQQTTLRLVKR